jgi:rare lipoprotein A
MKRIILFCVCALWVAVFCAAQSSQASGVNPFRQEGIASWYGVEFDGRPTASGEPFNSALLTAAHPSLPFGTILKVTNKHNNRAVMVRVNDRGPFVAARIIDVSRAAAEVLDMLSTGTAPVMVELVPAQGPQAVPAQEQAGVPGAAGQAAAPAILPAQDRGQTPAVSPAQAQGQTPTVSPAQAQGQTPASSQAAGARNPAIHIIGGMPPAESAGSYRLQVGAYKIPRNAIDALEKLKNAGLNPAYEKSGDLYRVVLPGLTPGDIVPVSEKIKTAGFTQAIIRKE